MTTPDDASPLMKIVETRRKESVLGYVVESEVDAFFADPAHAPHVDADGYTVTYTVVISEGESTVKPDEK